MLECLLAVLCLGALLLFAFYDDEGEVIEDAVLCVEEGRYGVNIPKGVWHTLESLSPDSCIFECKEGPFVPHEVDGILDLKKND